MATKKALRGNNGRFKSKRPRARRAVRIDSEAFFKNLVTDVAPAIEKVAVAAAERVVRQHHADTEEEGKPTRLTPNEVKGLGRALAAGKGPNTPTQTPQRSGAFGFMADINGLLFDAVDLSLTVQNKLNNVEPRDTTVGPSGPPPLHGAVLANLSDFAERLRFLCKVLDEQNQALG